MRSREYGYIDYIRGTVVPDAHKKHYGSYMSFGGEPISPGCMACKTGGWLCVFVGTKCNCTCLHCPNHHVNGEKDTMTASDFGDVDTDKIISMLESGVFTGVGISGGEPMLYIDKVTELSQRIKERFPQIYVWCYTNGVLAGEPHLKRLRDAGTDEIRFDLAADNYSKPVLSNMELAVKILPAVAIEVPVMVEQYGDLKRAISFADSAGVKYVNLHDLYVNDAMYKNGLGGYMRSFDPVSGIQRDIVSSAPLIYKLFRHIKDNSLSIVPNDCTLINMQLQFIASSYLKARYTNLFDIDFETYMESIFGSRPEDEFLIEKLPR